MSREIENLPGDLMIWVLIVSELLVFGAGLAAFMALRLTDPAGFAAAQDHLSRGLAGVNTLILVTSGLFAALAAHGPRPRRNLLISAALGSVFLGLKAWEYAHDAAQGLAWDSHPFFTFYYGLTGFHAAHVVAGIVILGLVALRPTPENTENAAAFWHMVDLVWVILFPVIYLLR